MTTLQMCLMLLKQDLLAICFLWRLSSPTSAGRATSSAREKPHGTLSVCRISHGLKLRILAKVSVRSFGLLALLIWQNYYRTKRLYVVRCCADGRVGESEGVLRVTFGISGLCMGLLNSFDLLPSPRVFSPLFTSMLSSPFNLWKKSLRCRGPLVPSQGRLGLQNPLQTNIPSPRSAQGWWWGRFSVVMCLCLTKHSPSCVQSTCCRPDGFAVVPHSPMFGISQEFIAQIQTSGMEGPYVYGRKTITCMETHWKLRAMMALLSEAIAVALCFSVPLTVDGIQQYRSARQVGESWRSTLAWRLLVFDCKGWGHCIQRSCLLTSTERSTGGIR